MKSFKQFKEESAVAANTTGAGNVQTHDPVANAGAQIKRERFNNCEVFEVDSEYYHRCTLGKQKYHRYERYVGNDEVGEAIRQYGRTNPKASIIVKDSKTGSMQYLRKG